MSISRRDFIKISAATFGVAAAGSGLATKWWGLDADPVPDPGTEGDRVVATFCEICFWKCGLLAHVKDGQVTKLVGNPAHPLSRGRLCPRGTGGTGLLYDPDRLRQPLVRRSKRGEQVFEPVSWEAALDEVAEKLTQLKKRYGPEALALYSHGCGGSWFKTLVNAYGTGNVTAPSYAQCRGAREAGFELTFGSAVGSPERVDIENARVLTFIGSHLGENMHNTQVQELAEAIRRGAQIIVVDPRYSTLAGKAAHWLPIKPGTDIALLLGWAHVMVREKLYDESFVAEHTVGFDQLKSHLESFTPEWAFAQTGIPVDQIVHTARVIAGAHPASLIHPGRRASWYGDDTQRARAVAVLNGLLGNWGRRGGFFVPTKAKIPDYGAVMAAKAPVREVEDDPSAADPLAACTPPDKVKHRQAADSPKGVVYPFAGEVLADGLRDASIPGTAEYDIKGWLVYGSNLIQSLPQPERTIEALRALEMVVAIDVLPMEITGWADVVLPEATYLERYDDLQAPGFKQGFISLRQPVVPPMYDSKPGWWIARELGRRLGLESHFPWKDAEELVKGKLEAGGHDVAEVMRTGVVLAKPEPVFVEDGIELSFATPSGKVELYSQQMADAGLPPLPTYTPPQPAEPGQLRLLFGRAPTQTFGRTVNNRFLGETTHEHSLWINREEARELGFANGDRVTLVNQDGVREGPIPLQATERIRRGCVYMVHGYGHDQPKLRFAHKRGASDSKLMTRIVKDPAMGGTGMNVNFVRIERAEA